MRAKAETGNILQLNLAEEASPTPSHSLDQELLRENLVMGFEPANEGVHPFFVLRSQLLKYAEATQHRIFAVTSVQPGDGKTHIAVNLAAALSRVRPTILVELDLRRGTVGERLGLPPEHAGIDDYLSGAVGLNETGIRIDGFDLTVHRKRMSHGHPETLLGSSQLTEMAQTITAAPDHPICIIDTPPAVMHDDMMLIAPAVQGLLMVVQEGRTSRHVLMDTVGSLASTPLVGTVLNMSITNHRPVGGYDYYYNHTDN